MTQKLYLHIGAHKTASSFIQTLLRENDQALLRHGLKVVPRPRLMKSDFYKELSSVNRRKREGDVEKARKEIYTLLPVKKGRDCLFTSEDLFSSLRVSDFYQNIKESLRFLKSLLDDQELHVILYIRRQADYVESKYTQFIHIGRSVSFDEFLEGNIPRHLSWEAVANDIAEVVGESNVHVKPYESIKKRGGEGFFKEFLELVGINEYTGIKFSPSVETGKGANRSYSAVAMEIAKKVNPILTEEDQKVFRSFLQENFSTATHKRAEFFSEKEKKEIFDYYSECNRRVFEKYVEGYDGEELGYY
ncbi:hypothetical protein [Halomonas elongata]|uniref:hypothetical protein n=1 Tax=Halomonas elongata TaxID=2746 RepID=UPI00186BB2CA|nr:hypothetical protein [Halomonas elongata]MBW5798986.1 hypothetical protein [Halomonas elongata]